MIMCIESFHSVPKKGEINHHKYNDINAARKTVFEYIESWYNRKRIHSANYLILGDGKIPVMPYKRPMTKKGFFKKNDYVYDEYYGCYLCPNHQILNHSTTNQEGYREYKSDPRKCRICPYRTQCTESTNYTKVITRHVWESYMEQLEEIRHTKEIKEIYQKRKETTNMLGSVSFVSSLSTVCKTLKGLCYWFLYLAKLIKGSFSASFLMNIISTFQLHDIVM